MTDAAETFNDFYHMQYLKICIPPWALGPGNSPISGGTFKMGAADYYGIKQYQQCFVPPFVELLTGEFCPLLTYEQCATLIY